MLRGLALLFLATLLACGGSGGGSGPQPAPTPPTLAYTDPPAGGFRWTRNPLLSSSTLLVLDLQGPGPSLAGRGVVFTLGVNPGVVSWAPAGSGQSGLVQNLAFNLGSGVQLLKYGVQGGQLQAGIFQKGQGNAIPLDGALCRVALSLSGSATSGTQPAPVAPTLKLFPDIGSQLVDQTCAFGTLAVQ